MQRLPQVVARGGQKAGLGAVRPLGRLAGLLQLGDLSRYRGDAAVAGTPVGQKISPAVVPGDFEMPLSRAMGGDAAADPVLPLGIAFQSPDAAGVGTGPGRSGEERVGEEWVGVVDLRGWR